MNNSSVRTILRGLPCVPAKSGPGIEKKNGNTALSNGIQSVRGMNDILPAQSASWQYVEAVIREVLDSYGYGEIRLPVVEKTALFSRSIGEVTDIVEKEMYTFEDRNGESLSLRPEGTAGCVRAGISNGLLYNQVQRLWYQGPMFRHERPQKGRYRQFHQVGLEAYGLAGPDIDAEVILVAARLWKRLGIRHVKLELNSLGTPQTRVKYRDQLRSYFSVHSGTLDDDSRRRLHTNPLRILDSKNPAMQEMIAGAPALLDYLDTESRAHFEQLQQTLSDCGVAFQLNPRLVRGLDYYSRTVFEWISDRLGAQDAICSGGRYDALVELLGGKAMPAIGWALGLERLLAVMEAEGVTPSLTAPDVYLVLVGAAAERTGMRLAEQWRDAVPGLRLLLHCGGGGFKAQLKKADKSGARHALILGDDELVREEIAFKPLRGEGEQRILALGAMTETLRSLVKSRET